MSQKLEALPFRGKRPDPIRKPGGSGEENVDTTASRQNRAKRMFSLLGIVTSDLDGGLSEEAQGTIRSFLLHVAWHEGVKLTRRKQMQGGPARSFFQFEMAKARDAADYAIRKNWLGKLAARCNCAEADLKKAIAELTSGSAFPEGNLVRTLLETHDLFACYLARIAFKRVPETIPATNSKHAEYWYRYWKVTGGDPRTLRKNFQNAANEVDRLLRPVPVAP